MQSGADFLQYTCADLTAFAHLRDGCGANPSHLTEVFLFNIPINEELPQWLIAYATLKPAVERLLDLKMNVPEVKEIPRVDEINQYLDASIEALKAEIMVFPGEHKPDWAPLNRLFLDEVQKCLEL